MDEKYKRLRKIYLDCVNKWDERDSSKNRKLYIKDLNIIRTILLHMYDPFLDEFEFAKNMVEPERLDRDSLIEGVDLKSRFDRYKDFKKNWHVSFGTKFLEFTSVERDVFLHSRKYQAGAKNQDLDQSFIYSDYPSPVCPLSRLETSLKLNRNRTDSDKPSHRSPPIHTITVSIDTRWNQNIISREILKYVKDYQMVMCEQYKLMNPNSKLEDKNILKKLQDSLHPQAEKCPPKQYFDYFYYFAIEKKSYQEIAKLFKLKGDQSRGSVKKAITWITTFIDYYASRAKAWRSNIAENGKKVQTKSQKKIKKKSKSSK